MSAIEKLKDALSVVKTQHAAKKRILQRITPDLNDAAIQRIRGEAEETTGKPLAQGINALRGAVEEVRAERSRVQNPVFAMLKAARAASFDAGPGVAVLANALVRLNDSEMGVALSAIRGNPLLVAAAYGEIRSRPGRDGQAENENAAFVRELAKEFVQEGASLVEAEREALEYLASTADLPVERLEYGHQLRALESENG